MQKTRNPSCDSFARGFKSHPLRQKPGSPQAFRAFFLLRKVSFKSTKYTCLTHMAFYERGFEKHFQALYNSNRYNRVWEHSDKKRKKYLSTYSTRSIAWQRIMANHTVRRNHHRPYSHYACHSAVYISRQFDRFLICLAPALPGARRGFCPLFQIEKIGMTACAKSVDWP